MPDDLAYGGLVEDGCDAVVLLLVVNETPGEEGRVGDDDDHADLDDEEHRS